MSFKASHASTTTTADVFLSYAREDITLARGLAEMLEARGISVSMDVTHIGPGEDYEDRIDILLRSAARMVFLASDASLASLACSNEVRKAQTWGIPILPVLLPHLPGDRLPEALRRINYLRLRDGQLPAEALDRLLTTIRTDLPWERARADYARLAARGPEALIRSGADLREAEAWMMQRPATAEPVAPVIVELIRRSRAQHTRRTRTAMSGLAVLAVVFAAVASVAVQRSIVAEQRQAVLLAAEAERLAEAGRTEEALLVALEATDLAGQDPQVAAALTLVSGTAVQQTAFRIPADAFAFEHMNGLFYHDSKAELWRIDLETGPQRIASWPGYLYDTGPNDRQGQTSLFLHADRVQVAETDPLTGEIGRSLDLDIRRDELRRLDLQVGQNGRGLVVGQDMTVGAFAIAYDLSSGESWALASADPARLRLVALPGGGNTIYDPVTYTATVLTADGPGPDMPDASPAYVGALDCLVRAGVGLQSLVAARVLVNLQAESDEGINVPYIALDRKCTLAGYDVLFSQRMESGDFVYLSVVDLGLYNPPWFMDDTARWIRSERGYGAAALHSAFVPDADGAVFALGSESRVILPDASYQMPFGVGLVVMGEGHFLAVEALPWDSTDTTRRVVLRRLSNPVQSGSEAVGRPLALEPPCATPNPDGPEAWIASNDLQNPSAFAGIAPPKPIETPDGPANLCLYRSGDGRFVALSEGDDVWIRDVATDAQVAVLRLEAFGTELHPLGNGFLLLRDEREIVTFSPDEDEIWRETLVLRLSDRIEYLAVDRDQSRLIVGAATGDGLVRYSAYSTASWTRIASLGEAFGVVEFHELDDGRILSASLFDGVVPVIVTAMDQTTVLQVLGEGCRPEQAGDWRSSPCWPGRL